MKIDIHTHTKKTKSGDSEKRNIDAKKFSEIIKSTEVKFLAITNHNHFDFTQYQEFVKNTDRISQVWPGIELDIEESNSQGHLIVIVSPHKAERFSQVIQKLLDNTTADDLKISIEETVKYFDPFDPVYIVHYYSKKPALTDEDIDKLVSLTKNKNLVIKEATNSISAGIYVSHGHLSIYGSDTQDWNNYIEDSKKLPELRLPVESFEQFCLLLEKNESTIKTILDEKKHETINIKPFGPDESIELVVFNDINVLFGSKGTGKTEILRAISKYYNENGLKTKVYESSMENLNDHFDIKGTNLSVTLSEFGIDSCSEEIHFLKNATEENITSLSSYKNYFASQVTNAKAKKLKINEFLSLNEAELERNFNNVNEAYEKINEFNKYLDGSPILQEIIGPDLLEKFQSIIKSIKEKIFTNSKERFIESRASKLFNNLIEIFGREISRKTGKPIKPTTPGFYKYASNRIKIERNVKKIIKTINSDIVPQNLYVGDLGVKGVLYFKTEIKIQKGDVIDGKFNTLNGIRKTPQKDFSRSIFEINESLLKNDLFEKISVLTSIDGIESINDIDDLIVFNRYFTINDEMYIPSNGESSMLLLHKELKEEKEIYLLDEPEKSLGNDYINDVIVPLLKERAKMGKKIFVATHDANIAVRTLPYNSIYRKHNIDNYSTYVGNPFSNNLTNLIDSKDLLDWKHISMKTLEGGKEAFGERRKIYGNI